MERRTILNKAEMIMGRNFIGPDQLNMIKNKLGIMSSYEVNKAIPVIPFDEKLLEKCAEEYILVLSIPKANDGEPLTLNKMRSFLGTDPCIKEPCFYNQDWYLKEEFANECTLELKWHLLKKNIDESSRGQNPDEALARFKDNQRMPTALLCAFTFFSFYFVNNVILWKNEYVWCRDKDHNGDSIYVGRYEDSDGINKNGFSVHRYLRLTDIYGSIYQIL
jgi:hypothetical protein